VSGCLGAIYILRVAPTSCRNPSALTVHSHRVGGAGEFFHRALLSWHRYPSRTDQLVLKNVTLDVKQGTVLALVGPSGGGKSTIVALMERLYDPDCGLVEVGGVDVKRLDPEWMHSKVAMVSQEPTLFAVSIADNIRFGRPTATMEEVENAAKLANAHGFVSQFEDG
jgi:ABC-type multidrug transport system fused ATPase/permease subunit